MKSSKRPVWHISQVFWPPRGGQEYLIEQMCHLASEDGRWSIVFQPFNVSLLRPSSYSGLTWPPKTILVPLPTLSLFLGLYRRLTKILPPKFQVTNRFANDFSWRAFNWSLWCLSKITWFFRIKKITVIHYHVHQPYFRNSDTIIFSHGVEWKRPPASSLDRQRLSSLQTVVNDPCVKLILANDRDYFQEAKNVACEPLASRKLFLMMNPVNTGRFQPGTQSASEKLALQKIVMVRNVRPDRGVFEGIEAFLQFRSNPKFSNWCMEIFGVYGSDDPYYLKCVRLAGDQLGKSIHFRGSVRNSEIPRILSRATLALVPSIELEGTSLAALEAMAAGVPCVSTPVGGLRDLPTLKSRSTQAHDICRALSLAVASFDSLRTEQLLGTRRDFSLVAWQEKFLAKLAHVEQGIIG